VRLQKPIRDGKISASVEVIKKGEKVGKTVTFDLTTAIHEAESEWVQKMISSVEGPCLFFLGKKAVDAGGEDAGMEEQVEDGFVDIQSDDIKAFLHVDGIWWVFYENDKGVWELDKKDDHMQATWAGGTDMLDLCVRYILKDPDADVPVNTGAEWAGKEKAAQLSGKVHSAQAVELTAGKQFLHVAAEAGDLLLSCDDEDKFKDEAGKRKLDARSRVAAWADFNGDKRIDLLSWDGKAMTVYHQQTDGAFTKQGLAKPAVTKAGCTGLAAVDCGKSGKTGVIVSTPGVPLLWIPEADGSPVMELSRGKLSVKELGKTGNCLVADFDNDLLPDVLQMFEKGSLFYKGQTLGRFETAAPCDAALGEGRSGAFIGDYDHDGLLDVFTVSEQPRGLWNNRGGGKFLQAVQYSGEVAYISQPGALGGMTGDVNNDGRQDLFLFYSEQAPHLFFNRGYRSFGHCHSLDLNEHKSLPASNEGQQAGCLGDFNGDGGQDMAIVLKNGEVWVFFRDTMDAPGLCAKVALPVGGPFAGPVNVSGWTGDRALGAWSVVPGTSTAFFGQYDAGPCRFTWQVPGGKKQEKQVLVEEGPVRFDIKLK